MLNVIFMLKGILVRAKAQTTTQNCKMVMFVNSIILHIGACDHLSVKLYISVL